MDLLLAVLIGICPVHNLDSRLIPDFRPQLGITRHQGETLRRFPLVGNSLKVEGFLE